MSASCSCLGADTLTSNLVLFNNRIHRVSPATYVCVGCGTFITPGEMEFVCRGSLFVPGIGTRGFDFHHHEGCNDLLLTVAHKFNTGAYGNCSFVDCLDEWLMRLNMQSAEDRKILELGSEVIDRLNGVRHE